MAAESGAGQPRNTNHAARRKASAEIVDASVAKDDTAEPGPGQAMDLALRFEYPAGQALLIVLVEHWSSAS